MHTITHFHPVHFHLQSLASIWFRRLIVMAFSLLTTLLLLSIMHRLVASGDIVIDDEPVPIFPDVLMPKIKTIENRIEPPKKVEENIKQPKPREVDPQEVATQLTTSKIPVNVNVKLPVIKAGIGDSSMPIAQYLIQPTYPSRMLALGIEGYVDIKFDVTAMGKTENLQILASEPEGKFDRAALKAVAKWRYHPKMVQGQPVGFEGVINRVRFTLGAFD